MEEGSQNDIKYKLVGLENCHNHQSQWGLLLAQKMQREMKSELKITKDTPKTFTDLVIEKYRQIIVAKVQIRNLSGAKSEKTCQITKLWLVL